MAVLALPKVECVESTDNYGRFVAEPLERGFGVTIGNSLRRILLSSLPGAAITWVLIEGIQHEFSTIPYMKEDTIDFLLNIKAMRIRPLSQRPGKLFLEVAGEKEVYARDVQTTADFEIVNPDLYLATLDTAKAKLSIELNVELGRGYLTAASSDGLTIGAIPVDAVFSPVRRVNFSVERSSVREGSNEEKLLLEVWTDSTVTPLEAVSQSASILVEQFSCFRDLARALKEEGAELSWQRLIPPEQYHMPVDQLNLSTHTYNSLRRGGVTTLGQMLEKGIDGLSTLAGFGAKSKEEVEAVLKELDLPSVSESKEKKKKKTAASSKKVADSESKQEEDNE